MIRCIEADGGRDAGAIGKRPDGSQEVGSEPELVSILAEGLAP